MRILSLAFLPVHELSSHTDLNMGLGRAIICVPFEKFEHLAAGPRHSVRSQPHYTVFSFFEVQNQLAIL